MLTDPCYAGFVNRVHLVGGVPRFATLHVEDGEWRLDHEALTAAVGPKTKALLMMSPSMPTARCFHVGLARRLRLARDRDLLLIYDAAMERLLFDGREAVHPLQFDGMAQRTLVIGSLSKEFRMIGWRVGWVAGPPELIADVGWAHIYNTTTPVGIARAAATAVLAATTATCRTPSRAPGPPRPAPARPRPPTADPPGRRLVAADRHAATRPERRRRRRSPPRSRDRRHADDRLGRRGRGSLHPVRLQRRVDRAARDDPRALGGNAAGGVSQGARPPGTPVFSPCVAARRGASTAGGEGGVGFRLARSDVGPGRVIRMT